MIDSNSRDNNEGAAPSAEQKMEFDKELYIEICRKDRPLDPRSIQDRVDLIKILEKRLKTEFFNTRDFHEKVGNHFNRFRPHIIPVSTRVRKARKKLRWSQKQLAAHLGYKSHVSIAHYERGLRYPSSEVLKWLKDMGM